MSIDIEFIYQNLDKLFNINFVMLAFIITAITILQTMKGGRVEDFKQAGLFDEVVEYYNKSIFWNFISGMIICLTWFFRICHIQYEIKVVLCIISFILFFISMYRTYKAYRFLIYFIKKQS